MKDVYMAHLLEQAAKDERIVVLDADLMHSNGTIAFQEAYPDRSINVGVQEANMIGIAGGLSATGKVPFCHTFACFASRRALDQIYVSIAYAQLNAKIVGTDPGITAAYNGGTHMPFDDLGIMRSIPTMTVVEPVDNTMVKAILPQVIDTPGPFYIRIARKNPIRIYKEGSEFTIGKGALLREGKDVTIFAIGIMVAEALDAADILDQQGISAMVVNIFTLKPIDKDLVISCAQKTGAVVTAENHSIINGLGSAVAEVLTEKHPVVMERVGVRDLFGEVGDVAYLKQRFGLTADAIVDSVQKVLHKKN
ncbi:MAG: transketolase family protein [Firmicutes bacterium]|nr:transketolase family protein [Bacillota bacterium]